jgi:IS605 OrfB family transposase
MNFAISGLQPHNRVKLSPALYETCVATSHAAGTIFSGFLTELAALSALQAYKVPAELREPAMRLLSSIWLTVEDETVDNSGYIIAKATDPEDERRRILEDVYLNILIEDGLKLEERNECLHANRYALFASINPEAVIVNRRAMFVEAAKKRTGAAPREEGAEDLVAKYFAKFENLVKLYAQNQDGSKREKFDVTYATTGLFSRRFGQGKGADYSILSIIYRSVEKWALQLMESKSSESANSSADLAASVDTGSGLLEFLFTTVNELGEEYVQLGGSKIDALLAVLSRKRHKSSTLNFFEGMRKSGQESRLSTETLYKLAKGARTDAERCMLATGDKGPKEYLSELMVAASVKCKVPFSPSGDTRNFYFNAMAQAAERLVSHLVRTGMQESDREFLAVTGTEELNNIDESTKIFLDRYREEQKSVTGSKNEFEISSREAFGYNDVHKLWKTKNDLTVDDKVKTLSEYFKEHLQGKRGSLDFLTYMCGGSYFPDKLSMLAEDNLPGMCDEDLPSQPPTMDKLPAFGIPPEQLFAYLRARNKLSRAACLKRPMLRNIDPYLSPAAMRFGTGWMHVVHDVKNHPEGPGFQLLDITLWNGLKFESLIAKWHSNRINNALALRFLGHGPEVPLATTQGRLAGGVDPDPAVSCQVKNIYTGKANWPIVITPDKEFWGRIQRTQNSETLGEIEKQRIIEEINQKLAWNYHLQMTLTPDGPFLRWVDKTKIEVPGKGGISEQAFKSISKATKDGVPLSRLPEGLRICGGDYGINNALGCTIVVTSSKNTVDAFCKRVGFPCPTENDLFYHVPLKRDKTGKVTKRVIFRRIGPDRYEDGTECLSPWAKIEKQFILRLPGETEEERRVLGTDEMLLVDGIEKSLGVSIPYISRLLSTGYGDNTPEQKETLEEIRSRLSLESLLESEECAGGHFSENEISRDAIIVLFNLVKIVQNTIHNLSSLRKVSMCLNEKSFPNVKAALKIWWELSFKDCDLGKFANKLWNFYADMCPNDLGTLSYLDAKTGPLVYNAALIELKFLKFATWLKKSGFIEEILQSIEVELLKLEKNVDCAVKVLRNILFPSGKYGKSMAIRGMGGLSHDRINTLKNFVYQVMKPFAKYMDDFHKGENDSQSSHNFDESKIGQKEIKDISRLLDEREKLIANLLVSAALDASKGKNISKRKKNSASDKATHVPDPSKQCQVLVIENLSSLRTSSDKTKRENKIISALKPSAIAARVREQTQRFGILLIEVNPAYSSLTDSRTGKNGMRFREVTPKKFMSDKWIRSQVDDALEHIKNGDDSYEYILLKELNDRLSALPPNLLAKERKVFIPCKSGPLFISCDQSNSCPINADMNASANLIFTACIEPNWLGGHSKILVNENSVPVKLKYKNCPVIPVGKALLEKRPKGEELNEDVNVKLSYLWRFPSLLPIDINCSWLRTKEFFAKVRSMASKNLLKKRYPLYSETGFDP